MKYVKILIVITILSLGVVDLTIWYRGGVPIINLIYRIASGAPNIHLNGKPLMYSGTFKESKYYPYKLSDEGIDLYKAWEAPEGVPSSWGWIFVPREEKPAFRYKVPKYGFGF